MFCLRPPLKEAPSEAWKCLLCKEIEDVELAKTFVGLTQEQEQEAKQKSEKALEAKAKAAVAWEKVRAAEAAERAQGHGAAREAVVVRAATAEPAAVSATTVTVE
jgi:hypothetical protein